MWRRWFVNHSLSHELQLLLLFFFSLLSLVFLNIDNLIFKLVAFNHISRLSSADGGFGFVLAGGPWFKIILSNHYSQDQEQSFTFTFSTNTHQLCCSEWDEKIDTSFMYLNKLWFWWSEFILEAKRLPVLLPALTVSRKWKQACFSEVQTFHFDSTTTAQQAVSCLFNLYSNRK